MDRFERYLATAHRSPATRRVYVAAVVRWLLAGGAPGHIDGEKLLRYIAARRRACAVATVNLDLAALRAFYRLQAAWEQVPLSELARVPKQRKAASRIVRALTAEQVGEVLDAITLDGYLGVRDYALLRVLVEAGLRASEALRLEVGDLLPDGTLYVRGKGGHDRYVPISDSLSGTLGVYLSARAGLRPGKRTALWLAGDGRPLRSSNGIWRIVQRRLQAALGSAAGLGQLRGSAWRGHHPHLLRATYATALLRNGMPITAIAQLLGHADISTTAHYLCVDIEHLKKAIQLHPRGSMLRD